MALVTMRELLEEARMQKYAVGGFNVFNLETLEAVVEVAEELKTPLVIGLTERYCKFVDADILSAAMVRAAQKSRMPVALHLDHGRTYEGIIRAIRWGFTSVMFDGSNLPFAENLKRTKEITRIAHSLGISVEGELGYVGCYECVQTINEDNMVNPAAAAEFVEKTKVDALAVAVGNRHGSYRGSAKLNFLRLAELNQSIPIPMVLHGAARLRREEYRTSIQAGIAKINMPIDTSLAAGDKLKAELQKSPAANYVHLMMAAKQGVKESVRQSMLNFDCIAKVI
ncbi:MAG: class II fructose-bisphosphate aldolase family protein [Pelosinus sp.]|nr:class II fructose-bisphosphate aldolase family protein [Pelosinus sp.]